MNSGDVPIRGEAPLTFYDSRHTQKDSRVDREVTTHTDTPHRREGA
jgi:hypothetical protein